MAGLELSAKLDGDKQLVQFLRNCADKKQRGKILKSGVTKAIAPTRKETRNLAPVRSGTLKKAIGTKVKLYSGNGNVIGLVGVSRGKIGTYRGKKVWPAKYWHLVNRGTAPHTIRSRNGKTYRSTGAKANPILHKAVATTSGQIVSLMQEQIKLGIDKLHNSNV